MRNYIHVMLCCNLFVSQLLFLVGVEQTSNLVSHVFHYHNHRCLLCLVCLLCNSCGASVYVSSDVHVDVDGGRCPICVTGKGFY